MFLRRLIASAGLRRRPLRRPSARRRNEVRPFERRLRRELAPPTRSLGRKAAAAERVLQSHTGTLTRVTATRSSSAEVKATEPDNPRFGADWQRHHCRVPVDDVDAPFNRDQLYIARAEAEYMVDPHWTADDLGRKTIVGVRGGLGRRPASVTLPAPRMVSE